MAKSKLSAKHESFCREYVASKFNGTEAYKRIYPKSSDESARSSAADLLTNPSIDARWKELANDYAEDLGIDAKYVLKKIKETVERCSQAEAVVDKFGVPTGEWKFEHSGVLKGAELLGKYLKLFTDKVETKVEGEVEVKVSKVDLLERVKQLKGET